MYKRVSGTSFSINYFVSSSTWHVEYTDEVHNQRSSQILIVFFPSSFPLLPSFLLPSIFFLLRNKLRISLSVECQSQTHIIDITFQDELVASLLPLTFRKSYWNLSKTDITAMTLKWHYRVRVCVFESLINFST